MISSTPLSWIFSNPNALTQKGLRPALTFLKERNFVGLFFFVVLISAVRIASEMFFLEYIFEISTYQTLRFYLENLYYFLIAVFTVPALVRHFTREEYPPLLLLTVKLFPIMILAPWADYFLTGRTAGYENAEVTPGILIQVTFIIGSVMTYVYLRTRNGFKAFIAGIGVYLMLWFFAMPEFIFPTHLDFSSDIFMSFYYYIPFFIGSLIFFRGCDADSFEALKKAFQPKKLLASLVLVGTCAFIVYYSGYRVHTPHVFYAMIPIFLLLSIADNRLPQTALVVTSFLFLSYTLILSSMAFLFSLPALALALVGKKLNPFTGNLRMGALAAASYFTILQGSVYVPLSIDTLMVAGGILFFILGSAAQRLRIIS